MMTCHRLLFLMLLFTSVGCSSGEEERPNSPLLNHPISITLNCGVGVRVTDNGFEQQDRIGLFIVNHQVNTPGTLTLIGNHADNVRFTLNTTWVSDRELFWKDETTKADFYAYFPYGTPKSITAYPFKLKEDQSTEINYKASEFLWGKSNAISPTEKAVDILTHHLFACAVILVEPGAGFTRESLNTAIVTVRMNQVKAEASIDLTNGKATATGNVTSLTPLKIGEEYKVLVVPQTVSADNFITVSVDGKEYNLQKEHTFIANKRNIFTVTVNKTGSGINVGIDAWEDDPTDSGGTAE